MPKNGGIYSGFCIIGQFGQICRLVVRFFILFTTMKATDCAGATSSNDGFCFQDFPVKNLLFYLLTASTMVNHHFSPPFGEYLDFFPPTEQAKNFTIRLPICLSYPKSSFCNNHLYRLNKYTRVKVDGTVTRYWLI